METLLLFYLHKKLFDSSQNYIFLLFFNQEVKIVYIQV